MTNNMMSADDICRELGCSKSHAYKILRTLNKELSAQGYITIAGRVPRAFWARKMFGYNQFFNEIKEA